MIQPLETEWIKLADTKGCLTFATGVMRPQLHHQQQVWPLSQLHYGTLPFYTKRIIACVHLTPFSLGSSLLCYTVPALLLASKTPSIVEKTKIVIAFMTTPDPHL